jgi:hypothetical protein
VKRWLNRLTGISARRLQYTKVSGHTSSRLSDYSLVKEQNASLITQRLLITPPELKGSGDARFPRRCLGQGEADNIVRLASVNCLSRKNLHGLSRAFNRSKNLSAEAESGS